MATAWKHEQLSAQTEGAVEAPPVFHGPSGERTAIRTVEDRSEPVGSAHSPVLYYDAEAPQSTAAEEPERDGRQTVLPANALPATIRSFIARPQRQERVRTLQEWEGTVTEVRDTELVARLWDRTDPSHEEERAVFELEQVADDDLSLVQPGAVFYWTVGYRIAPHGQKTLFSELRFRRLPAWSAREVRRLETRPSEFAEFFSNPSDELDQSSTG